MYLEDCDGSDDDDLHTHSSVDAVRELRDWLYGQGAVAGAISLNDILSTAPGPHFDRVNARIRGLEWLRAKKLTHSEFQDKHCCELLDLEDLFYRSPLDVQLPKPWRGSQRPPYAENAKIIKRVAGNHKAFSNFCSNDLSGAAEYGNHLALLLRELRHDEAETVIRRIFAGFVDPPSFRFEYASWLFAQLGDVLIQKNQMDAARQVLRDALTFLNPTAYRWEGYKFVSQLATCWDQSGQQDIAESLLKKAFQLWEWQGYEGGTLRGDNRPSAGGRILAHLADLYSRTGRSNLAIQVLRWITNGSTAPDSRYMGPLSRYLEQLCNVLESTGGDVASLAHEVFERTSEHAVEQARKLIATPQVTADARFADMVFLDAAFVTVRELGLLLQPAFVKKVIHAIPGGSLAVVRDFERRASEIRSVLVDLGGHNAVTEP